MLRVRCVPVCSETVEDSVVGPRAGNRAKCPFFLGGGGGQVGEDKGRKLWQESLDLRGGAQRNGQVSCGGVAPPNPT